MSLVKKKDYDRYLSKTIQQWCHMRTKLGLKGKKLGIPRREYMEMFILAELDDVEINKAMECFLKDNWWAGEGLKYQDLEHFIRNYSRYLPSENGEEDNHYKIQL